MERWLSTIALVGIAWIGACQHRDPKWDSLLDEIRTKFPDVVQLSTDDLARWLADSDREPPILIDVRERDEYEVAHLEHARHIAPNADPQTALADVDIDRAIVAYCSVGYRSSQFADHLRELGYHHVYNLEGSIFKWANEDRPVYRDGARTDRVHPYDATWGKLLDERHRASLK